MAMFRNPKETWDEKKCERLARHLHKDGLGTPYPFKGYVGHLIGQTQRYNGGCTRNNKWYEGETFSLPKLAKGFKLVSVPTWGWRIIKIEKKRTPSMSKSKVHFVQLTLRTENSAFFDDQGQYAPDAEVARILRKEAERIENQGLDTHNLLDFNGNKVGEIQVPGR